MTVLLSSLFNQFSTCESWKLKLTQARNYCASLAQEMLTQLRVNSTLNCLYRGKPFSLKAFKVGLIMSKTIRSEQQVTWGENIAAVQNRNPPMQCRVHCTQRSPVYHPCRSVITVGQRLLKSPERDNMSCWSGIWMWTVCSLLQGETLFYC